MQQGEHRHSDINAGHRPEPVVEREDEAGPEQEWDDTEHESASRTTDTDPAAEIGKQRQTRRPIPRIPRPRPVPQPSPEPRTRQLQQKQKPSPHPAPPPPKRGQLSKDQLSSEQLLAKVTRINPDIATLNDVIFVQEQLDLLRAASSQQGHLSHDTGPHNIWQVSMVGQH